MELCVFMHLCLCIFMHSYIFMYYIVVAKSNNENGVRVGKVSMMDSSRKFGFCKSVGQNLV